MSHIEVNGIRLFYTDSGNGPETLVFSHGFLMNHSMFDHQIKVLSNHYRVIAFDHRCHGQSQNVRSDFGIYDLVEDAAALIRALDLGAVHFAGMSTGGFVALRLALQFPELIKSLILIDTAAGAEDPTKIKSYQLMMTVSRFIGLRPLVGRIIPKLMAQKFLTDPHRVDQLRYWKTSIGKLDTLAIRKFGQAIFSRDDVLNTLKQRANLPPTLIVVGEDDVATPVAKAKLIQSAIANSKLALIPHSGHTSPVEAPEMVSARISEFLQRTALSLGLE